MSYGLTFSDEPRESVERVRREQLESAVQSLETGDDPVEAIHDARKRIKKTRALLRLARPGLKRKAYRRRNRALRDAGRGMSGTRDADVLAETVDALAERFAGRHPARFFDDARAAVASDDGALEAGDHVAVLRQLADDEWPLRRALDADALADSLKSTYVRGRAAFERADRKPTTTNLHEWRKRVKDLWYQQRLLEDTWPGVMKAQAKEAKTLSKLLGEDHDLAMLAEHVDDEALHLLIAERRAELLAAARDLGRRVYAERPKAFARRSQRYVELAA
jgi:CHAD domain-containing protein